MEIQKLTEGKLHKSQGEKILNKAGEILKKGGLVAFPTETVYGLGADALNPDAAGKIYTAKGRPSDNPLIVHISTFDSVGRIVKEIPWQAEALSEKFWPGPLTMIMNKSDEVPKTTSGGLETVAIRMPANEIALKLISKGGGYIAAPSANTSGKPSPTKAEHVALDLNDKIDMLIDGGEVGIGIESTIIDLTGEKPVILRPGAITKEMLSEVIGEVEIDEALIKADSVVRPKAPGMKYKHYAPKAEITVVEGVRSSVVEYINEQIKDLLQNWYNEKYDKDKIVFDDIKALDEIESRVGILCSEETRNLYPYGFVKCLGSIDNEEDIARNLYGVLREFDKTTVEIIYSESFYTPKMGSAIMNRLLKAAGHHRVQLDKKEEE